MKLQGVVLTQDAGDATKIEFSLKGKTILLGKARTAGYGDAKVDTAPMPADWRELGQPLTASETFTLTLLSPMLVRDGRGQFSLDIEPALSARLGVTTRIDKDRAAGRDHWRLQPQVGTAPAPDDRHCRWKCVQGQGKCER